MIVSESNQRKVSGLKPCLIEMKPYVKAPVNIILAGAGARGLRYSFYAQKYPKLAKIVAVAEPREFYRESVARQHSISHDKVFSCWTDIVKAKIKADAVIITTQDSMHVEPAIAFADQGYHILLEKPMAPTEHGCRQIVEAAIRNKIIFGVCHVLRYTSYTKKIKQIIDSGIIGEVVSIQHLEPVGYWHQAHSFVRGNWNNEYESSPMLLAKSCHDLDWIRYIMGCRCEKISSFGSLYHFKKQNRPKDAADRCLDCVVESKCPYSAKKVYLEPIIRGETGWRAEPAEIITADRTVSGVTKALREGPYGKCVYDCDNNVVDNQIVNMQFEGGKTASFTMTAFTEFTTRKTRIFGTKGELYGCNEVIEHYDFMTEKKITIEPEQLADTDVLSAHGGGDYYLIKEFVAAVATNNPSRILSGPLESLETHLMVFAAEKARKTDTVIQIA